MADLKFTQLVPAGALAAADLLAIAQSPFGAGSSKSITGAVLAAFVNSAAGGGPFLPLAGGTMVGNILFSADDTRDLGATSATRPRTLFLGTSLRVQKSGFAATVTDGAFLENLTAAAVGVQQFSTALRFNGFGWGTTAGTSQATDWRMYSQPVQSTIPVARFSLDHSIAGGAFVNSWFMRSDGQCKYFAPAASSTGQVGLGLVGDGTSRVALEISTSFGTGNGRIGFGDGTASRDVFFVRHVAGVIFVHGLAATNSGNFGVSNTIASATSFETLRLSWTTNVAQIWTEKGSGGGTARALVLGADATELLRFGSATTLSFFAQTAVVRQTSGENLTNNVTAGGTDGTIDNYTDLVIYANDSAAIRNDIYQLSRKLKQVNDALRAYGLLT